MEGRERTAYQIWTESPSAIWVLCGLSCSGVRFGPMTASALG